MCEPTLILSAVAGGAQAITGIQQQNAQYRAQVAEVDRSNMMARQDYINKLNIASHDDQLKGRQFEAELKAEEEDEGRGEFTGYASVFGNKDLGNDVIEAGAFTKSLRRKGAKKIKMLYQHDTKEPIGVFDQVKEDGSGLYVKGRLALGTQKGKEVYELMKMGAIDGLSVGYRVDSKGYEYDKRKRTRRLKEVDLMEISAVTFPMNPSARIQAVKSDFTVREWERKLREVGDLSHSESKVAASAVHKALNQREVEADADLISKLNALTKTLKIRS